VVLILKGQRGRNSKEICEGISEVEVEYRVSWKPSKVRHEGVIYLSTVADRWNKRTGNLPFLVSFFLSLPHNSQ
jgi:hypothetical protein